MLDTTLADVRLRSALGLLLLDGIRGIGDVAVRKAVNVFETFGEMLSATDDEMKPVFNVKQRAAVRDGKTIDTAYRNALRQTSMAAKTGAFIVSRYDDDYPDRLKSLDHPPLLIFTSGDLSLLDNAVGFVGSREPTAFGQKVAYGMATAFAQDGWCVVSGLAKGVDSISHRATLDAGGVTCAVLPSGLDMYSSNAALDLAKRICANGGLILSEYGFGIEANTGSYIDRDRLITGLSIATVFVQGELQSGSMHSVKHAIGQRKSVYVPEIPERFLSEAINHTARDLARMSALQLASKLEWSGKVMDEVGRLGNLPVANAIMNREDYPRVFEELRELLPRQKTRAQAAYDIAATF